MPSEANPNQSSNINADKADKIDTGGGTFVGGNVNTGADFVAGNKYVTHITQVLAASRLEILTH